MFNVKLVGGYPREIGIDSSLICPLENFSFLGVFYLPPFNISSYIYMYIL